MGNDLIQIGFPVILKITFANLWKPIHNVIIAPASSDLLNLEAVERNAMKPFNQKKMFGVFLSFLNVQEGPSKITQTSLIIKTYSFSNSTLN